MHITFAELRQLCPSGDTGIMGEIAHLAPDMLPRYGIDTNLRLCHLMAQLCHESAGLRTTEEYASGAAYEGRADLGNTQPGDGTRYKGRGLIQLTGRANYRRIGARIGLDLEGSPELAAEFPAALETALVYWADRRLNQYADADDSEMITRAINGGLNGYADRLRYLSLAKSIWGSGQAILDNSARPTLRLGSRGPDVRTLQTALNKLMPERPTLTVDGVFGMQTEAALLAWQGRNGLVADGVAGPLTWASLKDVDSTDTLAKPPPDLPDEYEPAEPAPQGGLFRAVAAFFRRLIGA